MTPMPRLGVGRLRPTLGFAGRRPAIVGGLIAALIMFWSGPLLAEPSGNGEPGPDEGEAGLQLFDVVLLDSRDGFAIEPDAKFLPGERVHLYLQVSGYSIGREDRVRLTHELRALDPSGRAFYPPERGGYDTELAPQDENWKPVVRYSPLIPEHAFGGTFAIRVKVTDELAGASVSEEVSFEVNAPRIDPDQGLLVRGFRFRHHPSDPYAWESPDDLAGGAPEHSIARPGEQISASFFLTGYEVRDDNTFDVESQAWLLDSEGRKLVDFGVTRESGRPYYPRLWLPGSIRIQLDPEIAPGDYPVRIRVRDRIAGTEKVHEAPLQVRP